MRSKSARVALVLEPEFQVKVKFPQPSTVIGAARRDVGPNGASVDPGYLPVTSFTSVPVQCEA